ncbi:DsrE family protein [Marinobacter sp.]|uniref:DsrE family protein n=1 Tax=Marinobacter sp. TaxID=50741 RepID=UPI002B26ED7D|nr:DsrE family protein [Marinobacter sp.]
MTTLIVIDQAPYGSWAGREALDMAFSLAAFDQPAAMLFIGPGVNWLRKGQQPSDVGQKSAEKNLSAAPMFGIEALIADKHACQQYGLNEEAMLSGVELAGNLQDVLNHHQQVVFAG